MATLRLQVTDCSAFIVRRLQKTPSEAAKISAMVAAKLRSPLVFCPRCPEGQHPQETICLPTQVADTTILAIVIQLLEGRFVGDCCFSDVRVVAQYLNLEEDYLIPYLLQYMMDEATYTSPRTFKEIELLYVAGYSPWPNIDISLLASRPPPRTLTKAYELFPDFFQDTDLFGINKRINNFLTYNSFTLSLTVSLSIGNYISVLVPRFAHRFEPPRPFYFGLFGLFRGSGAKIQYKNSKVKEKQQQTQNILSFAHWCISWYCFDCTFDFTCLTQESFKIRLEECEERSWIIYYILHIPFRCQKI